MAATRTATTSLTGVEISADLPLTKSSVKAFASDILTILFITSSHEKVMGLYKGATIWPIAKYEKYYKKKRDWIA